MRGNVLSESEILAKKIADRCCRRNLRQSEGILEIVNDCSADLGMEVPEVICCETLTRSLSAFYFRFMIAVCWRHYTYLIIFACWEVKRMI